MNVILTWHGYILGLALHETAGSNPYSSREHTRGCLSTRQANAK